MLAPFIQHRSEQESGRTIRLLKAIYDDLYLATGLSRAKVSDGLKVLLERGIIARKPEARSCFQLANFNPRQGWGKLPAKRLYNGERIGAFSDFKLRSPAELVALKIYLLAVAFRDNDTNLANLSYDKFGELAGIDRGRIRPALSVLAYTGLLHTERVSSRQNVYAVSNAYRLAGNDAYRHAGTSGRSDIFADLTDELH